MALGGGTFTVQNKKLPGSYINFVAAPRASSLLGERGTVAMGLPLDWGPDAQVMVIDRADFLRDSRSLLGYDYDHENMKPLREAFRRARKVLLYKLAGDGAAAASNTIATAKYKGTRGNDLKTVVRANVIDATKFDVLVYLGTALVFQQLAVATITDLDANDFVTWKTSASLTAHAGLSLTGGTNGGTATAQVWQGFLTKLEAYSFDALACASETSEIVAVVVAFTKRIRDEIGLKFQTVVYNTAADHEGVVNVANASSLVYWVAGALAGAAVSESLTNAVYDGEYTVVADYSQTQLEQALEAGKFIFHRVGDSIRVLEDINSLTTLGADKSEDFKINQTIRVLDRIATDIATVFNTKYLGRIPNDESGRISLWSDVVNFLTNLREIRAIEAFEEGDVVVSEGQNKKAVVVNLGITPISAMTQLYMTVIVS
ncbi:MAG TPA: phage tail protein [Clostridiaceae bacterium]|nr:phage tail protein [Clostridiaceae bacterium]